MADPRKDEATSATAPGNGDVWNTMHDEDSASAGSSSEAKAESAVKGDAADVAAAGSPDASSASATDADGAREDAVAASDGAANAEGAGDEGADAGAGAAAESAEAAETVETAAQKEAAEWKDKYVRLHAEWDTYRRRQKEQAATQKALAAEKLVSSLIPVIDDMERSIDYAQKNGETGLLGGVEAVLAKFVDTLKKDGVEVIDPAGEPFEALEAQAVGTVDDASVPEETVADVYQKGYKIGTKVLRPAMVTITTGGPKREKPTEE